MIEGQEGLEWERWLEIAVTCEASGIETLFSSDHYAPIRRDAFEPVLDAWTTVAGLAAATNKLKLGVLVSPVTFRHPALLAKTVLTCDHISGGRVEVGMGAGWYRLEHERFGLPFPPASTRLRLLAEQLEIVKRIWSSENFSFEGEFYTLTECISYPKPVSSPHPRLIVGGKGGERTMEAAAKWADEYNTVFAGPKECRARRARLNGVCERIGRDPATLSMSLMTGLVFGESPQDVARRSREVAKLQGYDDEEEFGEAVKDSWLIGTPDQIVDSLVQLEEAGVERVMLQHLLHEDFETIEALGELVVPALEQ